MSIDSEKISSDFLEFASEQRLNILKILSEQKLNISKLAEILEATKPEVHRNVTRLIKANLIQKEPEGNFILTTYGKTVLIQIPSLSFISDHSTYFTNHSLGTLPTKFIQRLGALQDSKQIKGFVKVLEKWTNIQKNAEKYIYNILFEVPYNSELIEIISSKLDKGIPIRSIFSENAIVPDERKSVFQEKGFQKHVKSGILERRILNDVSIVILVTEKESAVLFPHLENEPDLSVMFASTSSEFHEWCLDYFEWCWNNSTSFQETKLKE